MTVIYLVLIEVAKQRFYRARAEGPPVARALPSGERWIHRRASRWSTHAPTRREVQATGSA